MTRHALDSWSQEIESSQKLSLSHSNSLCEICVRVYVYIYTHRYRYIRTIQCSTFSTHGSLQADILKAIRAVVPKCLKATEDSIQTSSPLVSTDCHLLSCRVVRLCTTTQVSQRNAQYLNGSTLASVTLSPSTNWRKMSISSLPIMTEA